MPISIPHFLCRHLAVIRMLDHAQDLGILPDVSDEGGFWVKRDIGGLAQEVGDWNVMLAGVVRRLKDAFGEDFESEISRFPDFEDLEAVGRSSR